MTDQKKILVLLDGSERSMQTVQYVGKFIPPGDMQVVLFHVFSGVPECYWDIGREPPYKSAISQLKAWEVAQKKKIDTYMEQAKQLLLVKGFSKASVEIKMNQIETGVARDILKEAAGGYSAVVLRRRGVGVLEGIVVGSVANKLIAKLSFLPVIIAGQLAPVKKILLAVDGSPPSIQAVEFAADYLGGAGYEVCLFHVIRGFGTVLPGGPEFIMPVDSVEVAKNEMMIIFHDLKEKLVSAGFEPEKISEKIIEGVYSRAVAIVREAEEGGYGAIVMGRRGLSRVEEFFMGRVSNKVIHGARDHTVWVI
ncbi:MAG: universal stress protein [Desulfobacteraceae bacterium]|nr:universal stress protein [Desulfobacteraceae bacterium]MBC2756131.1 universal stress protein [Desulfobacteraceae bacterium]